MINVIKNIFWYIIERFLDLIRIVFPLDDTKAFVTNLMFYLGFVYVFDAEAFDHVFDVPLMICFIVVTLLNNIIHYMKYDRKNGTGKTAFIVNMVLLGLPLVLFILILPSALFSPNPTPVSELCNIYNVLLTFYYGFLTIMNISKKLGRMANEKKLPKNFLKAKSQLTYYRKVIDNYSPGVLSYIDDFELGMNDIAATIMSLKLKGKIDITNNEIKVINNDTSNLKLSEKYILENIQNINSSLLLNNFKEIVIHESTNNNLVKMKADTLASKIGKMVFKISYQVISFMISIFLWTVLIALFYEFAQNSGMDGIEWYENLLVTLALIPLLPVVCGAYGILAMFFTMIVEYLRLSRKPTITRTLEGEKLNEKLDALRRFLEEYSLIGTRNIAEIELWEDYLMYSAIFNINKKVTNEILEIVSVQNKEH